MILRPNFIPTTLYQPETTAYLAAIVAAGGTINTRSLQHVDKFVRDCKEAGVWSKLQEVMPFAGDQLAAALVKVKFATAGAATSVNFVAGDFSEATGLTGDAATKYLNLGINANTLPATSHLCFYQRTDNSSSSNRLCLGAGDATDHFWLGGLNPNVAADGRLGKLIVASGAGQMVRGFYYLERKSTTDLRLYRNNTQIGFQNTNTVHATPNLNLFAWAWNNNGTPAGYNHMTGSFLSIGSDLSASERTDYYAIVQTLQTNLGRAV